MHTHTHTHTRAKNHTQIHMLEKGFNYSTSEGVSRIATSKGMYVLYLGQPDIRGHEAPHHHHHYIWVNLTSEDMKPHIIIIIFGST